MLLAGQRRCRGRLEGGEDALGYHPSIPTGTFRAARRLKKINIYIYISTHKSRGRNWCSSSPIIPRISRTTFRGWRQERAHRPGKREFRGKAAHHENGPKAAGSESLLPLGSTWGGPGAASAAEPLQLLRASGNHRSFPPVFSFFPLCASESPRAQHLLPPPHGFSRASLLFANILQILRFPALFGRLLILTGFNSPQFETHLKGD